MAHKVGSQGRKAFKVPEKEDLEGMSNDEIVLEYNVCRATATKWQKKRGLLFTSKWRPIQDENISLRHAVRGLKRWSTYSPAFVVMTDSQLGRAFKLSAQRIGVIRKKFGWPAAMNKFTQERSATKIYKTFLTMKNKGKHLCTKLRKGE